MSSKAAKKENTNFACRGEIASSNATNTVLLVLIDTKYLSERRDGVRSEILACDEGD